MNQALHQIVAIVGTRPEVIKLAPVIRLLRSNPKVFSVELLVVEQQGDILKSALAEWDLHATWSVSLPIERPSLATSLSHMLPPLYNLIERSNAAWVLVQGDTLTTFASALAATYAKRPIAHIEAGLRSFDRKEPFPEEVNRLMVDQLSQVHYAPTPRARENLLAEGYPENTIRMVGNTVIDAMKLMAGLNLASFSRLQKNHRNILVTAHRRENFGAGITNLCLAIRRLVRERSYLQITYILHPNPLARQPVEKILSGVPRIQLIEPVSYRSFLELLSKTDIVLTDSGGIQEEAPYFGKPVLVIRKSTERQEGTEQGNSETVGLNTATIVEAVSRLLDDPELYSRRAKPLHPYGDGNASERIYSDLKERLGINQ